MTASGATTNAMTVDVEEHFHVAAFDGHVSRDDWERLPTRVERNTERILALFERHHVRATFFVLGWVADRYPSIPRAIAEAGHEVASHGYSHRRATRQTPEEFGAEAGRAKAILEDAIGAEVAGYRAASFSICAANLWALDVLAEAGYRYSSSIYPVRHDLYGMPDAPRFPFRHREGGILEIPISTVRLLGQNVPCGGGGYFRLLPYAYFRWAYRRVNAREGQPVVFYFHPWEIDPDQPRQAGLGLKSRFRHYTNLSRMEARLSRLLADFRWQRMDEVFVRPAHKADAYAVHRRQPA